MADGDVVEDLLATEHAAMAVRRVLAQADIGDDDEPWDLALDRAYGALDGSVRVRGLRALGVLAAGNPEEDHAGHAIGQRRFRFFHRFVHRRLEDAGHRPDRVADTLAFDDE